MRFSEAVAEEARRFKQKVEDTKFTDVIKPCINLALTDVGDSWRWKQLSKLAAVIAIPTYTTGTANIVSDSNVVTLAAPAAVAADFAGRFFRKVGGSNTYRILSVTVSTNTLILDQPVIEATANGISYEIEKGFYQIPTEAREIIGWDSGKDRVFGLDQSGLRGTRPNYSAPINDIPFEIAGVDEFAEDYAVGNVASAGDTNVLTNDNASCEWLSKAKPGNKVRIADVDYQVKRVESNTRMVMYNTLPEISAEEYTLSIGDALTIRPFVAFTEKRLIQFQYIRHHHKLVHDDDQIVLNDKALLAVLDFAQAYGQEQFGNAGWETLVVKANGRLASAQATAEPVRAAFKQFPPLIPRGMGRG